MWERKIHAQILLVNFRANKSQDTTEQINNWIFFLRKKSNWIIKVTYSQEIFNLQ